MVTRPSDTQMNINIPYADLTMPISGPVNPFTDRNKLQNQNAIAGHVEEHAMSEHAFRAQHLSHVVLGYAANPSIDPNAPQTVGDLGRATETGGATFDVIRASHASRRDLKRKRGKKGDLDLVEGDGSYVGPWAKWDGEDVREDLPDQADIEDMEADDAALVASGEADPESVRLGKLKPKKGFFGSEKTQFHGKELTDYQGRTYMHPPFGEAPQLAQDPGSQECFLPKTCIHTWTGHQGGVSVVRTFPETGHMILSGGMDTKIKVRLSRHSKSSSSHYCLQLWDIYREGNLLRSYMGHSKAVKDVTFTNDGRKFLSCGYDRQMKLWDTETGQCLKAFSNGKIPYVVRFHPDEDKQHIFLAGMSDKKIIQV